MITGAVLSAAALAPAGASATVTCNFAGGIATITLTTNNDDVTVKRNGTAINAVGTGLADAQCGTASVTNTNTIVITDTSDGGVGVTIDQLTGGTFTPGATIETPDASEIEFRVDLDGGAESDYLDILGTNGVDTIRGGTAGINLNLAPGDQDADVTDPSTTGPPSGVEQLRIFGEDAGDDLRATGGLVGTGTGAVANNHYVLIGQDGPDTLVGGNSYDQILGNAGDDTMSGGGGPDDLDYQGAPGPVAVNLGITTQQNTVSDGLDTQSSFENLHGSQFADTLVGDGGPNFISANSGGGTIVGAGGSDNLAGGPDPDTILARDSVNDQVYCGDPLTDSVEADAAGVDTIDATCELVLFPPPVQPLSTPAPAAATIPSPPKRCKKGFKLKKGKCKRKKKKH